MQLPDCSTKWAQVLTHWVLLYLTIEELQLELLLFEEVEQQENPEW